MKKQWTNIKEIIGANRSKDIFLTLINEEGNIICANANMLKEFDLENPRLVKSNFFSMIHPEHLDEFKCAVSSAKSDNCSHSLEIYLQNGYYHPMKWEINLLSKDSGEEKTFLCLGYKLADDDQTGQFRQLTGKNEIGLPEELKAPDATLRAFMSNTPDLIWVLDQDHVLVFASASFFRNYELDEKKAIGKKLMDLVPGAVADALYEKHARVLQTGISIATEEKVKLADGTNINFHVTVFPIEGLAGKKLVGGHAVNLADKYAIEKQLRDANNRLMNLSRATDNAIWEWDMQTGKIFRNEALLDMIGYPTEETKGLSWWLRRVHPEDRNRVSDKVKETTEKNQISWQDEYRFKCLDGSYKHIRDRGFVMYENGLPVRMIGSLQDVTAYKELEDQLLLEKLQRQKEISETVIRVQEKERTRIGHELHDNVNQILGTVKLFVDMLNPSQKEEKILKEKSIQYLASAIEEIRKLSKELVVPEINEKGLIDNIRRVVDDIQVSTDIRIKFTHDLENNSLSPGKKVTLFRIVQEQMKNIVKYSKAQQVDIFLQCKGEDLQLIIKDDGIGFDLKQTKRGIGLSNIHDRTRFYNGTVDILTSPGNGCMLTVTMPCQ